MTISSSDMVAAGVVLCMARGENTTGVVFKSNRASRVCCDQPRITTVTMATLRASTQTDETTIPYFPEEREGWHGYIEWEDYPEKREQAAKILRTHNFAPVGPIILWIGY